MAYGTDFLTGGTASASSDPGASAANACDNNVNTSWQSSTYATPGWWKYDLGSGVTKQPAQITLQPGVATGGAGIKDWTLEGSNNDSSWTQITSGSCANNYDVQSFEFTAPSTAYRYFRLNITNVHDSVNKMVVIELELMEMAATDITVTASLLTILNEVQSPNIVIPYTFLPDLINLATSLQTPEALGAAEIISANILEVVGALLTPTILISSTIFPTLLSASTILNNPTYPGLGTIHNATKIISFNPLVVITGNDPLTIARIDTTDPSNPIVSSYTIMGVYNATDIVYDSIFAKVYVACAEGIIVELDATDFSSYVLHTTGVTSNLKNLEVLLGYQTLFAPTDNTRGEVVVMDDSIKTLINADVRWMQLVAKVLNCKINTQNASLLDTDFRWSQVANALLSMDVRFNNIALTDYVEPISRLDFQVFIDNVEATDVKMDEINIYHADSEKSKATIILARQHDNLDTTLEGVTSQITNQNALRIEIDGHIEFDGYIWQVDARSDNETVQLTAYTDGLRGNERSLVTLSVPSIDEQLNLHHALIHNPTIENPRVLTTEVNPIVYKGIFIDGGIQEIQSVSRWNSFMNSSGIVDELASGNFNPKQNWTYFWFATAKNFITGLEWGTLNYIGTSPTALTSDTWEITGLAYKYQRKFESQKTILGSAITFPINPIKINGVLTTTETKYGFVLGEAPYKQVSAKSGKLVTADMWEDKPNGLYLHRDESYDYTDYTQKILALEYRKIQNINGSVLPKTSAEIEIFIDAYYYYNINLLKRINIDNTTSLGIYNNKNGFPVSVKSIDISSSSMKISLRCDNQWSRTELIEIESEFPDQDSDQYTYPATDALQFTKFDPRIMGEVE